MKDSRWQVELREGGVEQGKLSLAARRLAGEHADVGAAERSGEAGDKGVFGQGGGTVGDLAHGECRQLELAVALAMKPRLLLLDEPMAGMGRKDGAFMTDLVAGLKGLTTIVLIEHDMEAVFRLADRISVLVAGRVIKTGLPAEVRADPEVRAAYLGHSY